MGSIKILSQSLVNQIAAGEVIERPAFAVKELVENSLDAGASEVEVDITDSGLTNIRIRDNGCGMDEEDIRLAFHPHATSKLPDEMLTDIRFMGFRGEALASLAAVSRLTICSRIPAASAGTKITVVHGNVIDTAPFGMPPGTMIESTGLFGAMPARKKFLKSPTTEFRHIVDTLTAIALAWPHVRFTLIHNTRPVFVLNAATLVERMRDLLGASVANQVIPITIQESYLSITGYIGTPVLAGTSPNKLYFSVNARPISDKLLTTALKEAYGSLLDPHTYPLAVLSLTIPNEVIDVNVHPRKQEIKFLDNRFIFDAVKSGVMETLTAHNLSFGSSQNEPLMSSIPLARQLKTAVLPHNPLAKTQLTTNNQILQVHNAYLAAQTDEGMILVDQHAAHERVLYEAFKTAYQQQKQETLSVDITWDVSPGDRLMLAEHAHAFTNLGFEWETSDLSAVRVTKIPAFLEGQDCMAFIQELLVRFSQDIPLQRVDTQTEDMIHFLACKGAIKAGDPLTQEQRRELLSQLAGCSLPYTCPHGRPTHIHLSLDELKKMFKRK